MLYYLFSYLDRAFDLPGAGLFKYISFRAGMAGIISLLIGMAFGEKVICYLRRKQVGETIRELGLQGQSEKKGTPTMGGIIIIAAILIPVLLFARLTNVYIVLLLITTIIAGLIGFADDYIKVFLKNKEGLRGRVKIIGQVTIGIVVGTTLYFNQYVVVRQYKVKVNTENVMQAIRQGKFADVKATTTTIPFVKDNELNYADFWPLPNDKLLWVFYVAVVTFIITAISNGANLTDGLDGLAAGVSAIVGLTLAILAYLSGNVLTAQYLNIMYLPYTGELSIFCLAFVGACIGFLWYNSYPAQVFMGDTGSLTLGALIAVIAISIRKELLLPVMCGVFLVENLSVMIQVGYFKYTKRKYGEGKRIFLMAPLHHHYQKKGLHEVKIVNRFLIVQVLLGLFTVISLKIR
ncbi:MAG: phospho-N-acetylmuramoyl-pentapeptide-transferase [Cytophagales bacterium]|nr:phospho-N-acetylmuramoyl-pentapeptide-transferase [Bernardetiaceae bacterium]MDW8211672.1 phospho-N-acetylmuramoyl-pentapeptide-transferase [Cytophagales bacterium]